ncbi:hypothetical protein, partial [Microcystis aeruginosa]
GFFTSSQINSGQFVVTKLTVRDFCLLPSIQNDARLPWGYCPVVSILARPGKLLKNYSQLRVQDLHPEPAK